MTNWLLACCLLAGGSLSLDLDSQLPTDMSHDVWTRHTPHGFILQMLGAPCLLVSRKFEIFANLPILVILKLFYNQNHSNFSDLKSKSKSPEKKGF
jgi:hypothetical protein